MTIENLSIQFRILDDTGKRIDSYPGKEVEFPLSYEYKDTLGFLSKNILFVTYYYPVGLFLQSSSWQITLVLFVTVLLVLCIIALYQTARKEKRSGKYRELFIDNIVHDLKLPVANQLKLCYLFRGSLPSEQIPLLDRGEQQLNEMSQTIHRMLLQFTDEHGLRLKLQTTVSVSLPGI